MIIYFLNIVPNVYNLYTFSLKPVFICKSASALYSDCVVCYLQWISHSMVMEVNYGNVWTLIRRLYIIILCVWLN